MKPLSVARVQYFDHQFLRPQDLTDEQAYHLSMRRRHNIGGHSWGIVSGLQLEVVDGGLYLRPGVAIDGLARELVVPERLELSMDGFLQQRTDVLEAWLEYALVDTDAVPSAWRSCGDATPRYDRIIEQPLVRLHRPGDERTDPRRPADVRPDDRDFGPERPPPDDPAHRWPVYLGCVRGTREQFTVDPTGRPEAGLRGESISSPSGRLRLQIGLAGPGEPPRFAVLDADDPVKSPLLEVSTSGELGVRGDMTITGDLTLAGGGLEFTVGTAATRDTPRPWQLYRVEGQDGAAPPAASQDAGVPPAQRPDTTATAGGGGASTADPGPAGAVAVAATAHELRIELPSGQSGVHRVAIGTFSPESSRFQPCLTVADDCSVTVHGNLVVHGRIDSPGGRVPRSLSDEVKQLQVAGTFSGIGGAGGLLPQFYQRQQASSPPQTAAAALDSPEVRRVLAQELAQDPDRLAAFAIALRTTDPEAARTLRDALGESS